MISTEAQFQKAIADSIQYLESDEARRSMEVDPYWPKWNSPWWHMTLLWELGLAERIPSSAIAMLLHALQKRYLHFFPLCEADLPPGVDPIGDIMCHCGLGTAYQILSAAGVNVNRELPWARKWFVEYQMSDGGWNCNEAAYLKAMPKSSVVSTLPILESMLLIPDLSDEEKAALDAGAQYLLKRRFVHSLRNGSIINSDWLKLTFPRFYEYDLLRGLSFVSKWAKLRKKELSNYSIEDAVSRIRQKLRDGHLAVERNYHKTCQTRNKTSDGTWVSSLPISEFPLLHAVSEIGSPSVALTHSWNEVDLL